MDDGWRARAAPRRLATGFVMGFAACVPPPEPPTEAGVSRELADLRSATLSEIAYDVALEVPAARAEPVMGVSVVAFRWDDPRRGALVLDFLNAAGRVSHLTVNGRPADWRAENDHVVLDPGALVRGARNEVRIEYTAGDEALNRGEDFLYTLFVPDRARFALPVFDQPDLRARFTLALTVPEGWVAVSNAPALAEPPRASLPGRDAAATRPDAGTFLFGPTAPIPTYLFAFAAGRFQVEEEAVPAAAGSGRAPARLRMFHRETDSARVARNRDEVFALHRTALGWLEAYTDVPYPFEKFDFVLIPSFQYGGMEHPGAVFYRQEAVLLEESATQAELLGRASLIAHETAHMWFGDLVTLAWFDDVWTKEVFANFMAAKIVHPSFPEVDHELRFLLAHHPAAYRVDRTAGANPIRQPLANLREAGTLYGPIIYQKAPVVMRHLERRLGEEALRDGLREYLHAFAFGSAAWPDLVAILDARSPAEDLDAWSRVWVEEPGRPTVEVVLEREGERVRRLGLVQTDPEGKGRLWPQRLALGLVHAEAAGGADGRPAASGASGPALRVTVEEVELREGEAWLDAWSGRPAPEFVLPGASGVEYAHFVLDARDLDALARHLPRLEAPLLRGAAWVTLWDAVLEGALPPERFLDLGLEGLSTEDVELNVQRILDSLVETWWRLLPVPLRDARAAEVERALWAGATGAGSATARAAFLGAYRRVALTPEAVGRLTRLWSGEESSPVALSEADQTALAAALAIRGARESEALLDRQAERITNPDRRARFDFVRPALSADPAVREAFFASLLDPANRTREPWVLEALSALSHPLRQEHARRFLTPALEALEEIQRTGDIFFPDRWLDAVLDGHNTPEAALAVTAFLEGEGARPDFPPRLRAKVLRAADGLFRAARIVHGEDARTR